MIFVKITDVAEDVTDIYLITYIQLQIAVYVQHVKIEMKTTLVDIVSIASLKIEHGVELLMTLMLAILYRNIRMKLQLHLKLQETRMKLSSIISKWKWNFVELDRRKQMFSIQLLDFIFLR